MLATLFPAAAAGGARHSYFESAATIVAFILLGRWLEAQAKGRAADAIGKLARLRPKIAHVSRDGKILDLPVEEVAVGDTLQVRPGEAIPVDGVVVEGASHVDESLVTGEAMPAPKTPGAKIIGGSLNLAGAFTMRAEKIGADTLLAGIVRLVETAQGARLPIQALADRVTAVFVPAVLALSLADLRVLAVAGSEPALALALVSAVNVLIIACPCAMGLATPAALMTGAGRAAELGVIFRQGDALQSLCGVRTVAFDKTGTLTRGRPVLAAIETAPGFDELQILGLAAAVEAKSEHPLGRALAEAARARGLDPPDAADFAYRPGMGVAGTADGRKIGVGSAELLAALGADASAFAARAEVLAGQGASCFFLLCGRARGGPVRRRRSGAGRGGGDAGAAAGAGPEDRRDNRRSPGHRAGRGRSGRALKVFSPASRPRAKSRRCANCRSWGRSPLSATASMTRRPWPRPMSESPWERERTSPSTARRWRLSPATFARSRRPSPFPALHCAISSRTCSGLSAIMSFWFPSPWARSILPAACCSTRPSGRRPWPCRACSCSPTPCVCDDLTLRHNSCVITGV